MCEHAQNHPCVCVCVFACMRACVRTYVHVCMCVCCQINLCCLSELLLCSSVRNSEDGWGEATKMNIIIWHYGNKKKGQKHFLSHKEYNLWIVENSETVWHAWSTRMRAQSPRNGRQSHVSAQRSHSAELGMQPCSLERSALIRPFHCGRRMDEDCRVRTIRSIRVLSHYVSQFSQYFWFCVSLLLLWDRAVIFDALLE